MKSPVAVSLLGVLLTSCVSGEPELRVRAAFDMSCDQNQLRLVVLDSAAGCIAGEFKCATVVGVDGCGHRASYVRSPGGAWVMNSDAAAAKK